MAFASLDYYFAGRPIPDATAGDFTASGGVPPDGDALANYIYDRLVASFLVPTAPQFVTWTLSLDHATWFRGKGVPRMTKEDQFPHIRALLDGGTPQAIGLVQATDLTRSVTTIRSSPPGTTSM